MGPVAGFAVFISDKDYDNYLSHLNLQLTQGRLPKKGANEIAVSDGLMKNRGFKIGDDVGDEINKNENLSGNYKIVGILGSIDKGAIPLYTAIGNFDTIKDGLGAITTTYIVHPKPGQTEGLAKIYDALPKLLKAKSSNGKVYVTTYEIQSEYMSSTTSAINMVIWLIIIIVSIVLTIAITLFSMMNLLRRVGEFALLNAIGYSKGYVIRRSLIEAIGQVIVAWIVGLGLTLLVYNLVNTYIFQPKGYSDLTIGALELQFSLPVPIAVIICSVFVVLWKLGRMDSIAIIEKRD